MFVSEISLWGSVLVALLLLVAMTALAFFDSKMLRRMLVIFGATVIQMAVVGTVVVAGSTLLCLPISVYMTVYSVLMACLTASMIQTMVAYQRNQHGPVAQKPGMSMGDSILPQVRTMAQPLVMVMPMLYAGMLLGGVPAFGGLIVVLLLIGDSFVGNVLAGVVALLLSSTGRRDRPYFRWQH